MLENYKNNILIRTKDNQVFFNLLDTDEKILMSSKAFQSEQDCVLSLKELISGKIKFIPKGSNFTYYFYIVNKKNKTIALSREFKSKLDRDFSMNNVKKLLNKNIKIKKI